MSTESITDRVLRDVLNSDTLGVYCGSDAFINAKRWRFLEAALAVLEERGMLADPADYLAPAEPFDAAEATSAPLDPSKVKAGDTVMSYDALDALPVGSVVLEGSSGAVIPGVLPTMPGVFHRFPDGWYVVAGQGARDDIDFPVTVLHVPAHQPAPEPEPEWEVDQLADITTGDGSWVRAIRIETHDGERVWQTIPNSSWWSDANVTDVRPLVVIDPAAVDHLAILDAAAKAWKANSNDLPPSHLGAVVYAAVVALGIEVAR